MYISKTTTQSAPIQYKQNFYSVEAESFAGKINFSVGSSRLFAYNNSSMDTAPPINYDIINEDFEFRDYLQKKYKFLYAILRMHGFNINNVPENVKKDITLKYTEFVEIKEDWFKINRASKRNSPVIGRAELEAWIKRSIRFCEIEYEKTHEVIKFKSGYPPDIIEEKIIKLLLPNLELLAEKFPAAMNILIRNKYTQIHILPGKAYIVRGEGRGVASISSLTDPDKPMVFKLSECDIFAEGLAYNFSNIIVRHELLHLIDCTADSSCTYRRKNYMRYVYILDKRLNGRLTKLLEKENKKAENFWNDFRPTPIVRLHAPEGRTTESLDLEKSEEKIKKIFLDKINWLAQKHRIAYPIFPDLKPVSEDKYSIKYEIGLINFETDLSVTEAFPRMIEAYLFNKDIFKQYSPELYDIVEKEIMPDFK